jgi:hypothetical protein
MIVEFPDTSLPGRPGVPEEGSDGLCARAALISACGTPPSTSHFAQLNATATVTGVGFFDIPHGQTGVAPNAVELHPVLRFSNSNCQPG